MELQAEEIIVGLKEIIANQAFEIAALKAIIKKKDQPTE